MKNYLPNNCELLQTRFEKKFKREAGANSSNLSWKRKPVKIRNKEKNPVMLQN